MAKKVKQKAQTQGKNEVKESKIPFPALWLSLIVVLVYAGSFKLGYTELDDIIFINEQAEYNADISHVAHSFSRGVFHETNDTYYRPLLLNSFVLNAQISGTDIKGYHVLNILLHLIVVLMLFRLLRILEIDQRYAFLLSILYAVHPVFVQAVSWVPGRNDTLLGIFVVGFLSNTLLFLKKEKTVLLIGNFLWLMAALFTKESALFVPAAAWILLLSMHRLRIFSKPAYLLYAVWIAGALTWFLVRSMAALSNAGFSLSAMGENIFGRSPVLIQYLGKAILPFNQSVFPMMDDTTYVFGIIALVLCAVLVWRTPAASRKFWYGGFAWFFILLLPVVLLPGTLNEQDFEHRLYVPFIGILIALGISPIWQGNPMRMTLILLVVSATFLVMNIRHQKFFSDPITFWEAAVDSTPHSGYATMMLAARLDDTDKKRADALMLHAFNLEPDQKYINFYMGKYYLDKGSLDSAAYCLTRELDISAYFETYFQLSRLAFEQKNYTQSRSWMEKYLELNPTDAQASGNYVLLLVQLRDLDGARAFVDKKQKAGMVFPQGLLDQIK